VGVVSAGHDHIGPRTNEFPVQAPHHFRIPENRLGDERTGLQIPPALQFENISFGNQYGARIESFRQRLVWLGHWFLRVCEQVMATGIFLANTPTQISLR